MKYNPMAYWNNHYWCDMIHNSLFYALPPMEKNHGQKNLLTIPAPPCYGNLHNSYQGLTIHDWAISFPHNLPYDRSYIHFQFVEIPIHQSGNDNLYSWHFRDSLTIQNHFPDESEVYYPLTNWSLHDTSYNLLPMYSYGCPDDNLYIQNWHLKKLNRCGRTHNSIHYDDPLRRKASCYDQKLYYLDQPPSLMYCGKKHNLY